MNDLVPHESPTLPQQALSQNHAVSRLGEWAASAEAAYAVATKLVQTSFVPKQFKSNPVEATAAILAGAEVGLNPMASLNAFDIIEGKAAPSALALRGIVQSQGHEIVVIESTEARCIVKGRRRGSHEWSEIKWTLDRAKKLGLTNKLNWQNQPTAMLLARATSEIARLIGADAILGIGYTIEELQDGADTKTEATELKPVARTMKLAAVAEPVEDPQVDEEAMLDDLVTPAQVKTISTLATKLGLTREQKYEGVAHHSGRAVDSVKELTKDEASRVIEAMQAKLWQATNE